MVAVVTLPTSVSNPREAPIPTIPHLILERERNLGTGPGISTVLEAYRRRKLGSDTGWVTRMRESVRPLPTFPHSTFDALTCTNAEASI